VSMKWKMGVVGKRDEGLLCPMHFAIHEKCRMRKREKVEGTKKCSLPEICYSLWSEEAKYLGEKRVGNFCCISQYFILFSQNKIPLGLLRI